MKASLTLKNFTLLSLFLLLLHKPARRKSYNINIIQYKLCIFLELLVMWLLITDFLSSHFCWCCAVWLFWTYTDNFGSSITEKQKNFVCTSLWLHNCSTCSQLGLHLNFDQKCLITKGLLKRAVFSCSCDLNMGV